MPLFVTLDPRLKKALLFSVLTFVISYLFIAAYFLLGGKWEMPGALVLAVFYMYMPLLATVILTKFVYHEEFRRPLQVFFRPNRWFGVALVMPVLLAILTVPISLLIPSIHFSPEMAGMVERFSNMLTPVQLRELQQQIVSSPLHPFWIGVLQSLIVGPTINALAAFGEEAGWRGFLLKNVLHLGFWRASAIVGIIWGFWHAPLILLGHNYPEHPLAGVFMMVGWTVLLSPLLTFVTMKARSVIAASIFHGTLNASAGLAIMVIVGGSDLTAGLTGLAGFITLGIFNLALLLFYRKDLQAFAV
ncbi:MAG: CPBP family intramembrane glutamic endopeptidase [Candidatus Peregrinibacteria bacterium]